MRRTRELITAIEAEYAKQIGSSRYDAMRSCLGDLLRAPPDTRGE